MRIPTFAAVLSLAFALASDAMAAPSLNRDRKIDIELREVEVGKVFAFLGEITETKVTVDPCVQGKVDLRLKNVPASMVFDGLASKLGFTYVDEADGIAVRCADAKTETPRVSLAEHDAPLPDVAAHLATAAHLDGVDYRASKRPSVNVTLERVKVPTALGALSDSTGVTLRIEKRRLVVTD